MELEIVCQMLGNPNKQNRIPMMIIRFGMYLRFSSILNCSISGSVLSVFEGWGGLEFNLRQKIV